jgi:hypothetical protein
MSNERYFRIVGQNIDIWEHRFEIGNIYILNTEDRSDSTFHLTNPVDQKNYWIEEHAVLEVFKPKSQKFVKLCEDGIGFRKLIPGYAYEVLFEDEGEWGYVYQVRELLTDNIINCKVSKNRFEMLKGYDMLASKETKEIVDIVSGSALDKQISGTHYKGCKIQPIEYIHANNLDYFQGNVVKYVTRHKDKNAAADIKKAIHYLELILELQYKEKP